MTKDQLIKEMATIKGFVVDCDFDHKDSSVEFECSSIKGKKKVLDSLKNIIRKNSYKRIASGSDPKEFEIYMNSKSEAKQLASMINDIMNGATGLENESTGTATAKTKTGTSMGASKNALAQTQGSEKAAQSLGKALSRNNVSHAGNGIDWGGLLNNVVSTAGSVVSNIFGKNNSGGNEGQAAPATTVVQVPVETKEPEKDNTMMYVAIGGGALVLIVVLLLVMKK